jgi:hypothetical protein
MNTTNKFEASPFGARRDLAQVSEGREEGRIRPETLGSAAALERRGQIGIPHVLARASDDEPGFALFQNGTRGGSQTRLPAPDDANRAAKLPFLIGSPKLLEITLTHRKQSIEVVSNRETFATHPISDLVAPSTQAAPSLLLSPLVSHHLPALRRANARNGSLATFLSGSFAHV